MHSSSGAIIVTREDKLLTVSFPTNSSDFSGDISVAAAVAGGAGLVLQDGTGLRVAHAGSSWSFEGTALPSVIGDEQGVTVEACPGKWVGHTGLALVTLRVPHWRLGVWCAPAVHSTHTRRMCAG
jgi:hypothetical protein